MVYAVPVNEEPSRCELSGDGNVSLCHDGVITRNKNG